MSYDVAQYEFSINIFYPLFRLCSGTSDVPVARMRRQELPACTVMRNH